MTKYQSTMCKGIAILAMYFHHLFYSMENIEKYNVNFWPFSQSIGHQLGIMCKFCVAIFVFITGYGYYKKREQVSNSIKTILKRLSKLMSSYWFIFILFFIIGLFTTESHKYLNGNVLKTIYNFLMDFLGIAWYTNTPTLNPTWWYISMALMFIILSPILIRLNQSFFGILSVVIVLGVGNICIKSNIFFHLAIYLFVLEVGMICAKYLLFEKIKRFCRGKCYIDIVTGLALLGVALYFRYVGPMFLFDSCIAILICYLVYSLGDKLYLIKKTLHILGKHSANGFMIHTFLYYIYFKDLYYGLKYFIIIWIALAITSLLASAIIEKAKTVLHYNKLFGKLIKKIS